MPHPGPGTIFEAARHHAGLGRAELWWAYFGLGGNATPIEFGLFLSGEVTPGRHDHDVLSQALNDRLIELGLDSPVPGFDELEGD